MSKSTASTVWKVILAILVGILVLVLVVEIGLRWFISHQMRSQFAEATPDTVAVEEEPSVSFGAYPLVASLVAGAIPSMEVTTPSTLQLDSEPITGAPAAHIAIEDLSMSNDPVAESLLVTTELPDDYVEEILRRELNKALESGEAGSEMTGFLTDLISISEVTANPNDNTFDIVFTEGIVSLELRPVMVNEQLTFEAASVSLFSFDLPPQVTEFVTRLLAEGFQQEVTTALTIQEFTVIPDGFRITATGQNVNLNELANADPDSASDQA